MHLLVITYTVAQSITNADRYAYTFFTEYYHDVYNDHDHYHNDDCDYHFDNRHTTSTTTPYYHTATDYHYTAHNHDASGKRRDHQPDCEELSL